MRSLREQELTADLVNVMIIIWTFQEALHRRIHIISFYELSLFVCKVKRRLTVGLLELFSVAAFINCIDDLVSPLIVYTEFIVSFIIEWH